MSIKIILTAGFFYFLSFQVWGADCSSALQFYSLQKVTPHIYYMRVNPSGDYLLLSGEKAVIIDFKDKKNPRQIATLMNREAYPVEAQGQWRWIASPNHDDKMEYFDFQDALKKGPGSLSVYSDSELNQFYHSSAELPGSTAKKIHFRTSIWTLLKYRDYTAYFDQGIIPKKVTVTKTKELCPNLKSVNFRQPILSKDGTEIAGLTKNPGEPETTKVYKINGNNKCALQYDVGFNTGKVSFSYPKAGQKPMITFTATVANPAPSGAVSRTMKSGVWVYDPNLGRTYLISPANQAFNVQYPGFTEDGRVFYATIQNNNFGVTVADARRLMSSECQ